MRRKVLEESRRENLREELEEMVSIFDEAGILEAAKESYEEHALVRGDIFGIPLEWHIFYNRGDRGRCYTLLYGNLFDKDPVFRRELFPDLEVAKGDPTVHLEQLVGELAANMVVFGIQNQLDLSEIDLELVEEEYTLPKGAIALVGSGGEIITITVERGPELDPDRLRASFSKKEEEGRREGGRGFWVGDLGKFMEE
jgi:hypothetical protein